MTTYVFKLKTDNNYYWTIDNNGFIVLTSNVDDADQFEFDNTALSLRVVIGIDYAKDESSYFGQYLAPVSSNLVQCSHMPSSYGIGLQGMQIQFEWNPTTSLLTYEGNNIVAMDVPSWKWEDNPYWFTYSGCDQIQLEPPRVE